MNLLVTGGCGFIGSNFIKHMLDKYDSLNIVNVDILTYAGKEENLGEYNNHPNYTYIHGDICDWSILNPICKDYSIDYIVNFAAESHVDRSIENSDVFVQTNITGTHTLLQLLHKYNIKKYIQISTDEVYGSLKEHDEAFTEETPLAPNSPYAASKAAADMLCRSFYETYNYPIVITRCSNNFGPNQFPEKLIPLMIKKAKANEKVPVYGDGSNIRDWIHVKDHCEAIDQVLLKGKPGEVYNIGGEDERRNIDIVKGILYKLNKGYQQIEYVTDRLGHDFRYAMDISKIREELGWGPKITFEDGIQELINE